MITLPSSLVWVTPDLAVAVVPHERHGLPEEYQRTIVAPQEWVQYDKPCEVRWSYEPSPRSSFTVATCTVTSLGGSQRWQSDSNYVTDAERRNVPADLMRRLPDCRDGRQVWEVRWCAVCGGIGNLGPSIYDLSVPIPCDECESARATLQVVPVVEWNHQWPVIEACVESAPDGYTQLWLYNKQAGRFTHIGLDGKEWAKTSTLDPLPVVGRDFVLVVRRVPS